MKLVRVGSGHEPPGLVHDPSRYLDELPTLLPDLPPGAAEFAADPDHYDFYGTRCIKDLWFTSASLNVDRRSNSALSDSGSRLQIVLEANPLKHDEDLILSYTGVTDLHVSSRRQGIDSVQLDEILPHPDGVSHEIALHGGTVKVVALDLTAIWRESSSD